MESVMAGLTLEQIAAKAREHKVTPAEKRAQRVSLIMGLRSDNSTLTRDEVADLVGRLEGHDTTPDAEILREKRKSG
jgi:phosphopantetheine adenylyltransferase